MSETETNQNLRESELELREQRKRKIKFIQKIFFVVWLAATVLTIGGCWYLLVKVGGPRGLEGLAMFLLACGLPIVVGGGYVVFKVIPETIDD